MLSIVILVLISFARSSLFDVNGNRLEAQTREFECIVGMQVVMGVGMVGRATFSLLRCVVMAMIRFARSMLLGLLGLVLV